MPRLANRIPCLLLSFLLIITGCGRDNLKMEERMDEIDLFHFENSQSATERLNQFMYGQSIAERSEQAERFKIVHISDAHLAFWAQGTYWSAPVNLVNAVSFANQPELRINAIVSTGDNIGNERNHYPEKFMSNFFFNLYANNYIPTVHCFGNHDNNMLDGGTRNLLTHDQLYDSYTNKINVEINSPGRTNYYYTDLPSPDGGYFRLIALDPLDQPVIKYDALHYAYFSQQQIEWLTKTALRGMTDKHSVVLLTHFPFQRYRNDKSTYMIDGDHVHPWSMVPEIIEAFRSKKSLTAIYPNQFDSNDLIHVDVDFSDSPGEFVCHLGGHLHTFTHFELKGLSNANEQLPPQKMIISSTLDPYASSNLYHSMTREFQTLSSNSFNIYAVDTSEKAIYVTYFGSRPTAFFPPNADVIRIPYL